MTQTSEDPVRTEDPLKMLEPRVARVEAQLGYVKLILTVVITGLLCALFPELLTVAGVIFLLLAVLVGIRSAMWLLDVVFGGPVAVKEEHSEDP